MFQLRNHYFKIRFLKPTSIAVVKRQMTNNVCITFIVKHKSLPVTSEIQLVGLSVSNFKLTPVLIMPKANNGIPKIESPSKVK